MWLPFGCGCALGPQLHASGRLGSRESGPQVGGGARASLPTCPSGFALWVGGWGGGGGQ